MVNKRMSYFHLVWQKRIATPSFQYYNQISQFTYLLYLGPEDSRTSVRPKYMLHQPLDLLDLSSCSGGWGLWVPGSRVRLTGPELSVLGSGLGFGVHAFGCFGLRFRP